MSCHIIWYHNISYDITTYHMISQHAVAIYHITALRHSMHVMIKDVLRLSGIVILILNISNLGKDAKKNSRIDSILHKVLWDFSKILGASFSRRSVIAWQTGRPKLSPCDPHPSMLPPWGKTEENSCFVLTPASKWYILYKFRRHRKQCRLLEVFLELIKPRSVWGILVQRLLDTSFAPKSCPDISWKMACKAPHLPSGVDSLRRNSVKKQLSVRNIRPHPSKLFPPNGGIAN